MIENYHPAKELELCLYRNCARIGVQESANEKAGRIIKSKNLRLINLVTLSGGFQLSVTINPELLWFCITALSDSVISNTRCSCSTNQMQSQLTQSHRAHSRFPAFPVGYMSVY